jgi:uracil-DNA glycosylase
VDHFLAELAGLRIGTTFNQYAETGPDDVPEAADIRLANLRAYLAERAGADVVCLGEAGGYQGMRWSGIAFTSERDLGRWGEPYVHRVLEELDAERSVILWNTVPTHPHAPEKPLSNRRPTASEIAAGAHLAMRLIQLVQPRTVVAVGRVAESILPPGTAYVRHPANAGGPAFREGMRAILGSGTQLRA